MFKKARAAVAALAVGAASIAGIVATASDASAAGDANVYLVLPTWLNNCPGGGDVRFMQVSVGDTWSGGDFGDDIVYPRVNLHQNEAVIGRGLCYRGRGTYWGPTFYQEINASRNGQAWYVGPAGVRHN